MGIDYNNLCFAGCILALLLTRFGIPPVTFISGLAVFVGFAVSTIANNIIFIYVFYGVIAGLMSHFINK